MNIIEKFSKKLLLSVLLLLYYTETSTAASLAYQLMKKFDISNIKTSFIETAQRNKNLLFLLGGGALLSFIAWKIKTKKMLAQRQAQVEQPPIKQVPVWSEPKIHNAEIAKYYQERVEALESILKKAQISEEDIKQIFKRSSENHAQCMQYDQGKLPEELPEEITDVIKRLLNEFNISEKNVEFVLKKGKISDPFAEVLIDNNVKYTITINTKNIDYHLVLKNDPDIIMIEQYFKILSNFVDCLGVIISKRLCFQNEIDTLLLSDDVRFSLNQHLAFLSHIASLFHSKTGTNIKTAYQYLSFEPSSYETLPMNDIRHIFSTELQSKLSLGTLLLSTFDYARYLGIVDQIIDFSIFNHMDWLPDEIKALLPQIPDNEKPNTAINEFVFDYFVFDDIYQSFSVQEGFMKKIKRPSSFFKKPFNHKQHEEWLKDETARLNQGFIDTLPNFVFEHFRVKQTEKNILGEQSRKALDTIIDNQIPQCMQAMMKMFLQRHAKLYEYENYKIEVILADLQDCSVGDSTIDLASKAWLIRLCKSRTQGSIGYFNTLSTFLHELGHLINRALSKHK